MTTITREQLRERAREKVKSLEFAVTQTAFAENRAELEEELELARIALASLEAEPYGYVHKAAYEEVGSCGLSNDHEAYRDSSTHIAVYTAPPAPVVPDEIRNKLKAEGLADLLRDARDYAPLTSEQWETLTNNWHQTFVGLSGENDSCRAAMLQGSQPVSNRDELPLDYLQGHKDGLEWAAQLAEANHPQTGDWLYDDPTELAKAIRKGPDMPELKSVPADADDNFYSWFGRFWSENYQQNNYTTSAKQMLGTMAEFAFRAGRESATQAGNSPVIPDEKGSSLQLRNLIRQRHAEWSQATFGDVGPVGPLKHLSKEALEAAAEPEDLSEWADMQFLLWDAQRRPGSVMVDYRILRNFIRIYHLAGATQ